jgi:hypothetical protein
MRRRWWRRPIPSAEGDVASLKQWLHLKRGVYQSWLLACFVGALALPISMQWVHSRVPAITWGDAMREPAGMPWWLIAWLFPFGYCAALAVLAIAFEALIYFLRLDRGDHAWSSMVWSLRGWRAALAWTVLPLALVTVPLARGEWQLWWAIAFSYMWVSRGLVPLLLPFFVLKPDYLRATKPRLSSRPAWPGWLPTLVLLGPALLPMWAELATNTTFPDVQLPDPPRLPLIMMVPVMIVTGFFLSVVGRLLWLNAHGGASLGECARAALRPRIFLPCIVLWIRWLACVALAMLVGFPAWLFLAVIFPQFDGRLPVTLDPGLLLLVHASRFVWAYWWLFATCGVAALQLVLTWSDEVGTGRLLLELGKVRER